MSSFSFFVFGFLFSYSGLIEIFDLRLWLLFLMILFFNLLVFLRVRQKVFLVLFLVFLGFLLGSGFMYFKKSDSLVLKEEDISGEAYIKEEIFSAGLQKKYLLKTTSTNQPEQKIEIFWPVDLEISVPLFSKVSFSGQIKEYRQGYYLQKPETELIKTDFFQDFSLIGGSWYFLRFKTFQLRTFLEGRIEKTLKEPETSFLETIILGNKTKTLPYLKNLFRDLGLSHILVISGLHLTIILFFFWRIFENFNRKRVFWVLTAFLLFYVLLTGASPSIVRAAVMALLLILTEFLGQKSNSFNFLVVAAFLMFLISPEIIENLSFQLSFLATAGIILFADLLGQAFQKWPKIIAQPIVASLSAQLLVLPIILKNFGQINLLTPITNIIIAPAMPILIPLGFIFILITLVLPFLTEILGLFLHYFLIILIDVLRVLNRIPSLVYFSANNIFLITWYLLLFLIGYEHRIKTQKN